MHKLGFLFGLVLLLGLGTAAQAQETPKFEIFGGYSYVRSKPQTKRVQPFLTTTNSNGGSGSVAYNLNNWFGVVADIGGYKPDTPLGGSAVSYLFGPRLSYRAKARYTPYVQVLFGGAHGSKEIYATGRTQDVFAMTAGGGVDWKVTDKISFRTAQVEYLLTRFDEGVIRDKTQNNMRVSTGIVFRF